MSKLCIGGFQVQCRQPASLWWNFFPHWAHELWAPVVQVLHKRNSRELEVHPTCSRSKGRHSKSHLQRRTADRILLMFEKHEQLRKLSWTLVLCAWHHVDILHHRLRRRNIKSQLIFAHWLTVSSTVTQFTVHFCAFIYLSWSGVACSRSLLAQGV